MMRYLVALLVFVFSSVSQAATIIIENQTSNPRSYLSGNVTVTANGNTTVPSQYIYPITRDPQLDSDVANGIVNINDGVTDYSYTFATYYLNLIASSLGGAVVGLIGSSVPSYAILVGAKDQSGNIQSAILDTNKSLFVTTNAQNSGTPTQTSVSCGNTSTTLLASSTATKFVMIRNPTTATQTVWVNVAGSAATAAAPNIDLPPGAEIDFEASENSYLPTSQLNCIAGSASTVTLVYK